MVRSSWATDQAASDLDAGDRFAQLAVRHAVAPTLVCTASSCCAFGQVAYASAVEMDYYVAAAYLGLSKGTLYAMVSTHAS